MLDWKELERCFWLDEALEKAAKRIGCQGRIVAEAGHPHEIAVCA